MRNKKKSNVITALTRKVNKPRLGLRVGKVLLSRPEKCILTTIFWAAGTKISGVNNLHPGMLGFNFGAMYTAEGYKSLPAATLKSMRSYMAKYHIKDWTTDHVAGEE